MAGQNPASEKLQAPPYSTPPKRSPSPSSNLISHASGAPAPAYNTPRILHIYRDGLTSRHMTITDMDKSHPLYHITQSRSSFSKPHITIHHPSSSSSSSSNPGPTIGTVEFHSFSRTIDLHIHNLPIAFQPDGIFTRAYAYHSPSFGEKLRWECDGIWGSDLVLVNGRKEWIARFEASVFAVSKAGKIHIADGGIGGKALDEIVVSGYAMVQHERRRRNNGAAAGAC
ncbi:MAG: hypothetical protein Q9184_003743 [Pyrenodesmia sp. 2 TL-2023]